MLGHSRYETFRQFKRLGCNIPNYGVYRCLHAHISNVKRINETVTIEPASKLLVRVEHYATRPKKLREIGLIGRSFTLTSDIPKRWIVPELKPF